MEYNDRGWELLPCIKQSRVLGGSMQWLLLVMESSGSKRSMHGCWIIWLFIQFICPQPHIRRSTVCAGLDNPSSLFAALWLAGFLLDFTSRRHCKLCRNRKTENVQLVALSAEAFADCWEVSRGTKKAAVASSSVGSRNASSAFPASSVVDSRWPFSLGWGSTSWWFKHQISKSSN